MEFATVLLFSILNGCWLYSPTFTTHSIGEFALCYLQSSFRDLGKVWLKILKKLWNFFFWSNLCKTDHQNLETFWNMYMIFCLGFLSAVLYILWSVWLLKGILLFATLLPTGVLHQKSLTKTFKQKMFLNTSIEQFHREQYGEKFRSLFYILPSCVLAIIINISRYEITFVKNI